MSIKLHSLGTVAAAARGIVMSGATNATPIVLTVTAGHRQKNGDRVGVVANTGNTAANGDFTLSAVAATEVTLTGSAGNGTQAGTPIMAVLCDQTPFLPRHSAVITVGQPSGAVFVGTLLLEAADRMASDLSAFQYDNTSGVATSGFKSALMSGEIAIPAATAGQVIEVEVSLSRYMALRCSAYTSGVAAASIKA